MYRIIALFGKSGSGKDTIQKWLVDNYDFNGIVSCTTREKRDYEIEGKDYHFLTIDQFHEKVLDSSMLEASSFNGWFYGTSLEALIQDKINVGVFNPIGIECLLENSLLEILPIYIQATDKIRLIRSLTREDEPDCKEIVRRFETDEKDFKYISFPYLKYFNNNNVYDFKYLMNLIEHTSFFDKQN